MSNMSNVVDLAEYRKGYRTRKRLEALTEAGLTSQDVSVLSIAANRAFSDPHALPSFEQASEMGFEHLKWLYVQKENRDDCDFFQIGTKEFPVLYFVVAAEEASFKWAQPNQECHSLADLEDPGRFVGLYASDWVLLRGLEVLNLYGLFALEALYFACNGGGYNPKCLYLFPETGHIAVVVDCPVRKTEIAWITNTKNWVPDTADLAVPAKSS